MQHFTGAIPSGTSVGAHDGVFYEAFWLERFETPLATAIGAYAFFDCSGLTTVIAPNVTKVERYAYSWCTALTSVDYLPKGTSVGNDAFADCYYMLTFVDLPVAETIGDYAFLACENLQTVKFGYPNAMTWGSNVFSGSFDTANINLFLGAYEYSTISGTSWKGYTFKSISPY